jgi:hypothetical protein
LFGMLDYRAHKLFWLLTLPLRLVGWLLIFVSIGAGIAIAQWTEYPTLLKIIIGYVACEGISLVLSLLYMLLLWVVQTAFFWIIDVVPAKGADEEEARQIVLHGRIIWLAKKFNTDVENWTPEDTRGFVSAMNWRARRFFNTRERFETRIERFQEYYYETGRQPGVLTKDEMNKLIGDLEAGWFETAIVNNYFFYSILKALIVGFAILYLS